MSIVSVPGFVPGGILERVGKAYGLPVDEFDQLLLHQPCRMQDTHNNRTTTYPTIPPHTQQGDYGPVRSDVLIVGKLPTVGDLACNRNCSDERGRLLTDLLTNWNVNFASWVFTNACWCNLDVRGLPASYRKEWLRHLAMTINAVEPRFILALGTDALKSVIELWDKTLASKVTFTDSRGSVINYAGGIKLLAGTNPGTVLVDPASHRDFVQDIGMFCRMAAPAAIERLRGAGTYQGGADVKIHEIADLESLQALVGRLVQENKVRFAIDAEWGGGGQLRTFQFSWSESEAAVVIFRRCGMVPAFTPNQAQALVVLSQLFNRPGVTVCGHNVRGDLQVMASYGLNLWDQFINGGFDTMLGYHEIDELNEKQLELVALRMLGMPRYDTGVRMWLSNNKYDKEKLSKVAYGDIPDEILHPYAGMDAIAVYRLIDPICQRIQQWPGLWNHYVNVVHPVNLPINEMEVNGTEVDLDRVRVLADLVKERLEVLTTRLRENYNWPDFNPGSPQQVAELLFDYAPLKDGVRQKKRPEDAVCFHLTPIKSTDKPKRSMAWERVMALPPDEQTRYAPATDQETVKILAADCPALKEYLQWKTIDQLRKNFLRPEEENEETGELEFSKGVGRWTGEDGRIHTRFRLTLETGRYATSPNCFDAHTEVLTRRGWVAFPDLGPEDYVAQMNMATSQIDFALPEAYHVKAYKGEMLGFRSPRFDWLCTPEHRCVLTYRGKNSFIPAREIPTERDKRIPFKVVQAGRYTGGSVNLNASEAYLIAVLQARASVVGPHYRVVCPRTAMRDDLESALKELGVPYEVIKKQQVRKYTETSYIFEFAVGNVPISVSRYVDPGPAYLELTYAAMRQLRECFKTLITRQGRFHRFLNGKIQRDVDWLQILCLLSGAKSFTRRTRVSLSGMSVLSEDMLEQDIRGTKHYSQQYDGLVYCVTMPQGTVVTRRNFQVVVSGQCQNWPKRTEPDVKKCFAIDKYKVLRYEGNDKVYWDGRGWSRDSKTALLIPAAIEAVAIARYQGGELEQQVDPRYSPLRTVLRASPGCVLIEPDWNQAELWTLAALARCDDLLHILATSDLHTEMMRKMFSSLVYRTKRFDQYTVKELKTFTKSDKYMDMLRTCAKTTVFGIPYQRGAAAIIREVKKQGVKDKTTAEAQGWIDTFYNLFPPVYDLLESCKRAVITPGYICNPYGRYRRAPKTADRDLIADYQREFCNYPIQSTVGDSMSVALLNFYNYKRDIQRSVPYRLLMSIHDAVLLETQAKNAEAVVNEVVPTCMVKGVEVPGYGLHYGIGDIDVQLRWMEKPDPQELLDLGVARDLCGFVD